MTSEPGRRGLVVWFTGLPGAGKTTLAAILATELRARGMAVSHLDGDQVRHTGPSRGLGYSKLDRDENVARVAAAARDEVTAGAIAVVSVISPYAAARQKARALIERQASFVEVYVATPLAVCARRDPKGLYARAYAGEVQGFTGVSAPYEPPAAPEVTVDTTTPTPAETLAELMEVIAPLLEPRVA